MRVSVFSLGCKVNQYESDGIITELNNRGYSAFSSLEPADVYVINTCSVTAEADRKSRQSISRVQKLNPNAKIIVIGCSSQNNPTAYEEKDNIVKISGNSGKMKAVLQVMSDITSNFDDKNDCKNEAKNQDLPLVYEDVYFPTPTKTRGFIKIQDGCNNFCSYCIVPYLRGRSRSRNIESIKKEATDVSKSCKEIVLTGIDISAYGKDTGSSLKQLLHSLNNIPSRIRLGSLECSVIDEELLKIMKDGNFCPHFHLSFQSGSNAVLKNMNRHYTVEEFLAKTELIKKYFPLAGITTDIICGFPQESEANHLESLRNIERIGFSQIHVFPYSEREGTVAAKRPQLQKSIRKARANETAELGKKLHENFLNKNLGLIKEVLTEDKEGNFVVGYTDNYIKIYSDSSQGEMLSLKLKEIYKEGVLGV